MKCPYCGGETMARKCEYCNSDLSEYYMNNGTIGGTVSGIINNVGHSIANSIGGNQNVPPMNNNVQNNIPNNFGNAMPENYTNNVTQVTQNIIIGQTANFQNIGNVPLQSPKSKVLAIILCIVGFFGLSGLHRIYTGKYLTGLLWLFTYGLCGLGTLIDLILLLTNKYNDSKNRPLLK